MSDSPTVASLIAANERFYRTFESLDYAAMDALWEHSERAFCVHPGWPPLHGAKPVLESWWRIIGNTSDIRFALLAVSARVEGDLGIVTLYEQIQSTAGGGQQGSGAATTNLFAFDAEAGMWKLFHHHASPSPLPGGDTESPLN